MRTPVGDPWRRSTRKQKGPANGAFSISWRSGWDERFACGSAFSLVPTALRESNRVRKPIPHSARNQKWGHQGPIFNFWRRGWDSNPRRATNPCWFSRPVHSTALPPLQNVIVPRVGLTQIGSGRSSPLRGALRASVARFAVLGGLGSVRADPRPSGAHFVRPDSLCESVESTKGY